jgi:GTP-binding protein HflX
MNVIIVDIADKSTRPEDLADRMAELENLVHTYGGLVVVERVQKRDIPDYRTFIGSGKLREIMNLGHELKADLIVIGNILKPSQIYNINEFLRTEKSTIKAWDRIDLILKIFSLHANSPESKLQIELASIKHMGPRIFGMGMELSRQGGGVGSVGIGETNTERMKRHLKEKERAIHERLQVYVRTREQQRKSRTRKGFSTVGIVGYTNAGKSTLMNALTHKGVLAENKLFATLGTSVGKTYIAAEDGSLGTEVLINDTIGFIRDLPPDLIEAFSSTLEDSIESTILLHVIDASDPRIEDRIQVVNDTLAIIGAKQPRIHVFNKTDQISHEQKVSLEQTYRELNPLFLSAAKGDNIDNLKRAIALTLSSIKHEHTTP